MVSQHWSWEQNSNLPFVLLTILLSFPLNYGFWITFLINRGRVWKASCIAPSSQQRQPFLSSWQPSGGCSEPPELSGRCFFMCCSAQWTNRHTGNNGTGSHSLAPSRSACFGGESRVVYREVALSDGFLFVPYLELHVLNYSMDPISCFFLKWNFH